MAAIELCDLSATEDLGQRVGRALRVGDLLVLSGELGSGKTSFVRGLARGMGLANKVQSPSFQLLRLYRSGGCQLAHADAYRMSPGELADLGIEELLEAMPVAVEWGERLGLERWPGCCWLAFEHAPRGRRVIARAGPGHLARALEP